MALTQLTTSVLLERFLSSQGMLSFADDDSDTVADCINYATVFLFGKLAHSYLASALPGASLLKEFANVIASRVLCTRRGNPVPESLEMRYQEIIARDGLLDQVAKLKLKLINDSGSIIAGKGSNAPVFSNLRVDRRYPNEQIRVVEGSSAQATSKLERDTASFGGAVDG